MPASGRGSDSSAARGVKRSGGGTSSAGGVELPRLIVALNPFEAYREGPESSLRKVSRPPPQLTSEIRQPTWVRSSL